MARKKPTSRKGSTRSPKAPAAGFDASTRFAIITGPEEMLKREELGKLIAALEKEHGEIQRFDLDGNKATLAEVLDELRTFSLMQQYKLVIVDNADAFVNESTREKLEKYADNPVDNATLVLRSTTWRPGRLDKKKNVVKVKCDPFKKPDAARWLTNRFKTEHGCAITSRAAAAMVERLGTSLMRLDVEAAKLALLVAEVEAVDIELLDQVVGRSSEEKAWAIQDALLESLSKQGRGAGGAAIEKLHELNELADHHEVLLMYSVTDLIRKLALGAAMNAQGVSPGVIAKEVRYFGTQRNAFLGLLQRFDEARLGRAFDDIIRADRRSKSGFGNAMRNLECFCAALADEL